MDDGMIFRENTVQMAKELANEMVRLEEQRKREEQREAFVNLGKAMGSTFHEIKRAVTEMTNAISEGIKESQRKEL